MNERISCRALPEAHPGRIKGSKVQRLTTQMKEKDSRVIKIKRTVQMRSVRRVTITLCVLFGIPGSSLLCERNMRVDVSGALARPLGRAQGELLVEPRREHAGSGKLVSDGSQWSRGPRTANRSEDGLWRVRERSNTRVEAGPRFYLTLNELMQQRLLKQAPMEFTQAANRTQVIMKLPMADGTFARFRIEESPVLATSLSAQFPEIRTYRGQGLDDPTAVTRLDVTPAGFHAIILSSRGTSIIEPTSLTSRGEYVSYNEIDAPKDASSFSCLSRAEQSQAQTKQILRQRANSTLATGATLRTYRLALAATAEFTQTYGGGTVAGALNALTTLINAVNAIYERDLAIHFTLVANETSIIFTNTATDGYTSNDANALLEQNHTLLNQRLGTANYDLGMVIDGGPYNFQPGKFIFQGAAQFQSVCANSQKGKAVSIFRSTDPTSITAIYVVAHELGHMLGALHTFNGTLDDCGPSRFAVNAYEPGSGSTIMGFRGGLLPDGTYYPLCASEELFSNDTYFHTASIEQITNYTSFSGGSVCGVMSDTGNTPPSVDAGPDYTIPANTPFTLTAGGSDAEADALTFCWEQYDLGAAGPPDTDNGNRPIFRSFAPLSNPARTFPQLSDILSGTSTFGESLPTTNRTMNFRVTVRDNHAGGGGVSGGTMHVNVVSSSGPFIVTQPGAATSWPSGSTQSVTWNVANTSTGLINCASVRVLLSVDGGSSFPFILASGIPNGGAATVNVPNLPTSSARVKVEAIDNIFFNISPANFTITANTTSPPTLLTEANSNRAIAMDSVTFMRDPLSIFNLFNFSLDQRTRVMLFATGLELMPNEDISVVTARAEDSAHRIYPLTVEYVGKVPNFDWLTQVKVKLADGLSGAGDILVSVSVRGAVSNQVIVRIQ